jgi:hypothetical protein
VRCISTPSRHVTQGWLLCRQWIFAIMVWLRLIYVEKTRMLVRLRSHRQQSYPNTSRRSFNLIVASFSVTARLGEYHVRLARLPATPSGSARDCSVAYHSVAKDLQVVTLVTRCDMHHARGHRCGKSSSWQTSLEADCSTGSLRVPPYSSPGSHTARSSFASRTFRMR